MALDLQTHRAAIKNLERQITTIEGQLALVLQTQDTTIAHLMPGHTAPAQVPIRTATVSDKLPETTSEHDTSISDELFDLHVG